MKLSNFERQQFNNRVKSARESSTKEVSIKDQVANFEGRVVSIAAAVQRIRYKGMTVEEACLTPSQSKKGVRNG